jgi:hypothetical protein
MSYQPIDAEYLIRHCLVPYLQRNAVRPDVDVIREVLRRRAIATPYDFGVVYRRDALEKFCAEYLALALRSPRSNRRRR